jgi:hypothetical protein
MRGALIILRSLARGDRVRHALLASIEGGVIGGDVISFV